MQQPDDTWRRLVATRAPADRALARALPYRIGVTWRPDGPWGDYVRFDVLRDLPSYVADALPRAPGSRALARFRRAHHCAGFYGLLVDRVADGQVREDRALRAERAWLRRAWASSLAAACGSARDARALIARAERRWADAVATERRALRAGALDPASYAAVVRGKVSHLWVAAEAMLAAHGAGGDRRGALRDVFERVMIALQCSDDASDAEEDRALRGASVAGALGVTDGALHAAAALMLRDVGRASALPRLGAWSARAALRATGAVPPSEAVASGLGALWLVESFCGAAESA